MTFEIYLVSYFNKLFQFFQNNLIANKSFRNENVKKKTFRFDDFKTLIILLTSFNKSHFFLFNITLEK